MPITRRDKHTGILVFGDTPICEVCRAIAAEPRLKYCKYHLPVPCQHPSCDTQSIDGEPYCPKHRKRRART